MRVPSARHSRFWRNDVRLGYLFVWNTFLFSAGLVPFNILLALGLAIALNQKLPGTTALRAAYFSPVVISLVAWSIVWQFILADNGAINGFLTVLGFKGTDWLYTPVTAMASVIVVQVFKNVGLNMLLFLAALQTVPIEQTEAARLDGAGAWATFRHVVLAYISPVLLLVIVITVIGSLQVFAQIMILTAGGPGYSTTVLEYFFFKQAFQFAQFGYASAVAVVIFVVTLAFTAVQWRLRHRMVFYET
jgi:multiple sugar transport system permease protein